MLIVVQALRSVVATLYATTLSAFRQRDRQGIARSMFSRYPLPAALKLKAKIQLAFSRCKSTAFYTKRGDIYVPFFQSLAFFRKTRPICLFDSRKTSAVTRLGARKARRSEWLCTMRMIPSWSNCKLQLIARNCRSSSVWRYSLAASSMIFSNSVSICTIAGGN